MKSDNILSRSDVFDEFGAIRPVHPSRGERGEVPTGRYTVLRNKNIPLLQITYQDGIVHGPYIDFWSNGRVACEGHFENGKREGIWHFYNKDGTVNEIVVFKLGKEISTSLGCHWPDSNQGQQ